MACPVPWKKVIVNRLRRRDNNEKSNFGPAFDHMAKLSDACADAKRQNSQMTAEIERLKKENLQMQFKIDSAMGSGGLTPDAMEKMQADRNKLYTLQSELTDVLREKSQLAQQTLSLSNQMQEKQKQIDEKEQKIQQLEQLASASDTEKRKLRERVAELYRANQAIKDEHQASQLALKSIEDKFTKLKVDHDILIEKYMKLKQSEAERLNLENDQFTEQKMQKQRQIIADAVANTPNPHLPVPGSGSDEAASLSRSASIAMSVTLPRRIVAEFDCHDGECDAVRWGPSSEVFATGGWDRKLNIWSFQPGETKPTLQHTLFGCNAGIMGIDFDPDEQLIAVASNDFASRVWNLSNQRIVHTLTGHTNKVMAARFCGHNMLVTGSHDRTLKIWDLHSRVCSKTIFAGSSCNDLVTIEMLNNLIISGHFDKRLRFWDRRTDQPITEVLLQNRITSVDVDNDKTQICVLSRDDILSLIDLRNNRVLQTYTADGFHTAYDWSRAVFSPDGQVFLPIIFYSFIHSFIVFIFFALLPSILQVFMCWLDRWKSLRLE